MKAALPEATSAISVPPSSRVVETRRTSICLCWRCFPREGGVKAERIYHPPRKRGDGGLTSEYQRAICANWSKAACKSSARAAARCCGCRPDTLASCLRRFLAHDLASAWDWCRTLSNVQKTSHRHGRQVADSRQLGFSKKLVNRHLIPEWQATCEMGMFQQLLTTLLC